MVNCRAEIAFCYFHSERWKKNELKKNRFGFTVKFLSQKKEEKNSNERKNKFTK